MTVINAQNVRVHLLCLLVLSGCGETHFNDNAQSARRSSQMEKNSDVSSASVGDKDQNPPEDVELPDTELSTSSQTSTDTSVTTATAVATSTVTMTATDTATNAATATNTATNTVPGTATNTATNTGTSSSGTTLTSTNTSTSNNQGCTVFLGDDKPLQLIHTQEELAAIDYKNGNYKLANDISLVGDWMPIHLVNSIFDGGNFTIRNLNVKDSIGGGLFASVGNSIIKNLKLDSFTINLASNDPNKVLGSVGGFAGLLEAATIDNIHLSNGIVRGQDAVGGFVGIAKSAAVAYHCLRQADAKIINSSVTNVEVQSYRGSNAGAIAFSLGNTDVSGTTTSQITWRKYDTTLGRFSDTAEPLLRNSAR